MEGGAGDGGEEHVLGLHEIFGQRESPSMDESLRLGEGRFID
jgi:hypothetical protein